MVKTLYHPESPCPTKDNNVCTSVCWRFLRSIPPPSPPLCLRCTLDLPFTPPREREEKVRNGSGSEGEKKEDIPRGIQRWERRLEGANLPVIGDCTASLVKSSPPSGVQDQWHHSQQHGELYPTKHLDHNIDFVALEGM